MPGLFTLITTAAFMFFVRDAGGSWFLSFIIAVAMKVLCAIIAFRLVVLLLETYLPGVL